VVLAHEAGVAVRVNLALRLTSSDGVRLGDQALQAPADGVAELVGHAHGSRTAWRRVARVRFFHTPLVGADVSSAAVGVHGALWLASGDRVRVGDETLLTSANRIADRVDHADGSWATR
jgi:hypothetical protein